MAMQDVVVVTLGILITVALALCLTVWTFYESASGAAKSDDGADQIDRKSADEQR